MNIKEAILMETYHGSHLYGLNTPDSDVDFKGVFLPNLEDLLLQRATTQHRHSTGEAHEKNTKDDVDRVMVSLPKFIMMACEGETMALDMLHAPTMHVPVDEDLPVIYGVMKSSPVWEDLVSKRHLFYTKNMKSFLGYARKQASKYGVKGSRVGALEELINIVKPFPSTESMRMPRGLAPGGQSTRPLTLASCIDHLPTNDFCFIERERRPNGNVFYNVLGRKYQSTIRMEEFKGLLDKLWKSYGARAQAAKDNEGIDWKAISHAVRAAYQLKDIYENGTITYPLHKADIVLKIKKGEMDFVTEAQPLLEGLINEVEILADKSDYPETVDREYWDNWLLDVFAKEYNIEF